MKKNMLLLFLIVLLVVVCVIVLTTPIGAACNLSGWIVYGFAAPVIYSGVRLCTRLTDKKYLSLILGLSIGMLIPLFLSRGADAFLVHKILATVIGGLVAWGISKIIR